MKFLNFFLFFIALQVTAQQGGMWIPSLLEGMNEQEMSSLGSKLSASDIYDVNQSSLKDGLILTNHHCGFSQIQSHSTVENDYITNGFWAKNYEEELPNEGLYIDFIVRIEDVTAQVLNELTDEMSEKEKQSKIDSNSSQINKKAEKEDWQGSKIKAFYKV